MVSRTNALFLPERPHGSLTAGLSRRYQDEARKRASAGGPLRARGALDGERRAASERAGRAEKRVPSSRRPPRAVMRGRRATYPPRRVYVADLVTDYGREEVGTQSPTAAAQATRRMRPHVSPTSALMRLSRPLRRREQKAAQAADGTAASSPTLPSPTPTASLRGRGRRRNKVAGSNSAPCWQSAGLQR